MPDTFSPSDISSFRFTQWQFDANSLQLSLRYAFDEHYAFVEEITFPATRLQLSDAQRAALSRCFDLLHLVAGISYYKAAAPNKIVVENQEISSETARFLEELYRGGLGEFAFQNKLQLHHKIHFPYSSGTHEDAIALTPQSKTLIPVGGGKDSIVSIESLKKSGIAVELFSVGSAMPIINTAERSGLPYLQARRKISPKLIELNKLGAYNGHIPITAIVSLIAVATAIIHGHQAIAFSNERSANIGNTTLEDGFEVNHQFSKSYFFEGQLAEQIFRSITPSISYFSLLRPYSELQIARSFSHTCRYDDIFTSCNSNFAISGKPAEKLWCCNCPKCRFVFLMLAPFMDKARLISIFGKNLLDDLEQKAGYDALLGIGAHKPFECVGEYEESLAALALSARQDAWRGDALVAHYGSTLLAAATDIDSVIKPYLTPAQEHQIPEEHLCAVRNYLEVETAI